MFNYFFNPETQTFSDWVNLKNIGIESDDLSPRVLHHWEQEGIIPLSGVHEKNKRREFNLVELVWIFSVMKLRDFGMDLKSIKKLRISISDIPEFAHLLKKVSPKDKKWFYNRLKNSTLAYLEFAIFTAFFEKKPTYLIINVDRIGKILTHINLVYHANNHDINDLILVNLHSIIQSIFPEKDLSPKPESSGSLVDNTFRDVILEVYTAVSDSKTVEMKFTLKNGDVDSITIDRIEDVKSALDFLSKKDEYQKLEVLTKGNNVVNVKRSIRKKLKK